MDRKGSEFGGAGNEAGEDAREAKEVEPMDVDRYSEMTEYIREVDEILDLLKPFPRDMDDPPPIRRSTCTFSPPGIDHLENLIKLVEQLKDLKDKNTKMQEKSRYLRDLKKLHERKKRLKFEANKKRASPTPYWLQDAEAKELSPGQNDVPQGKKYISSLPFRKSSRGRSKSVNIDDSEREEQGQLRRKSSSLLQKTSVPGGKSKVSKWTKVKEAFRWEKTSEPKGKDGRGQFLQVPQPQSLQLPQTPSDKGETDSALSGHVSPSSSVGAPSSTCLAAASSGYSGEHSSEGHSFSSDLPPPPPPPPLMDDDFLSLPLRLQDLSSSSSSEKLDELLTYSEMLSQGDDQARNLLDQLDGNFHLNLRSDSESARRSKSLDGDLVLGPSSSLVQHLSKDSLLTSKLPKTHKTPWGKVKDIIQTRRGSLKKKTKKRDVYGRPETSQIYLVSTDMEMDELSSPEEKPRDTVFAKPRIEVTAEYLGGAIAPAVPPRDSVITRRLTPVLTITLPSTEELRSLSASEEDASKRVKISTSEEKSKQHHGICEAEYFEDIPKYEKGKSAGIGHRRFSQWTKVKKAFLTSASPTRSSDYISSPTSVPSSPIRHSSFFSDVESDELSSGEWAPSQDHDTQFDIHRNYRHLQRKLTHEFNDKICEWEKIKGVDTKQEEHKNKSDDWEKTARHVATTSKQRDSMHSIPLPTFDDLSPEFKKKLDEWKKIKKSQTSPTVPHTLSKDELQTQNLKTKIGEWQKWKPGVSTSQKTTDHNLPEEFCKKLEEWEKIKRSSNRRSRSHSERGKDEIGHKTPSPRLSRKNSKSALKKVTGSSKSSGTESLSGSLKEKEGRSARKAQKEKDLQWLEKELQKIEREKLRLEREREKYLEREARLERMKRTMGTATPKQEVLIQTPTGFFRFEGISEKFTKRLYEWELARGIAPEASTFALLEECAKTPSEGPSELQRSKSVGSVIEISPPTVIHHPSSLSLNDVDELEILGDPEIGDSRASSEPVLQGTCQDDEPRAIIVDVEDVVEETAALMIDQPMILGQVPVYSYAPAEVTQLIDSSGSGSEGEKDALVVEEERKVENEDLGCRLINHNIDLLGKLQTKETICRQIESDLEDIAGRMQVGMRSGITQAEEDEEEEYQIRTEEDNLKHSFTEHSEQQQSLSQHLTDGMRLLQDMTAEQTGSGNYGKVRDLSSRLLHLAENLNIELRDRNIAVRKVKESRYNRSGNRLATGQTYNVFPGSSEDNTEELVDLPSLITNKVIEMRKGLTMLRDIIENSKRQEVAITGKEEVEEDKNTASYVVQFSRDGHRNSIVQVPHDSRTLSADRADRLRLWTEGAASLHPPPSTEDLSPITVTISPPFWTNRREGAQAFKYDEEVLELKGVEKSKVQVVYGESAAQTFEKNLKQKIHSQPKSPEVIKKKIKEKISLMQRMTTEPRPRVFQPLNLRRGTVEYNTDDETPDISVEAEEKVVVVQKNGKAGKTKKMLKARRITDSTIAYKQAAENRTSSEKEDSYSDEVFLRESFDPTSPAPINFPRKLSEDSEYGPRSSTDQDSTSNSISTTPPVSIFVPTSRKIISPVRRNSRETSSVLSYFIDDIDTVGRSSEPVLTRVPDSTDSTPRLRNVEMSLDLCKGSSATLTTTTSTKTPSTSSTSKLESPTSNVEDTRAKHFNSSRKGSSEANSDSGTSVECIERRDIGIPPLPNSPTCARKASFKEAAPSIRMIIARLSQKQDNASEVGSGSSSPVVWRSPVTERRVKMQVELFQEDVNKILRHGGKFERGNEVKKSASAGYIKSELGSQHVSIESLHDKSRETIQPLRGILKSSSAGTIKVTQPAEARGTMPLEPVACTKPIDDADTPGSSARRALRIKQAKEEFLSRGPGGQSWTSDMSSIPTTPTATTSFLWPSRIGTDRQADEESKSINRLSHISVGSESSYDEPSNMNLMKSASVGMINLQHEDILRRSSEGVRTSDSPQQSTPSKHTKFGLSTIKSKFRKVKMRKTKEKEQKMATVSLLCRQSLFLEVPSDKPTRQGAVAGGSKSCPSSPVLERSKPSASESKSWMRNPAKKIFKKDGK